MTNNTALLRGTRMSGIFSVLWLSLIERCPSLEYNFSGVGMGSVVRLLILCVRIKHKDKKGRTTQQNFHFVIFPIFLSIRRYLEVTRSWCRLPQANTIILIPSFVWNAKDQIDRAPSKVAPLVTKHLTLNACLNHRIVREHLRSESNYTTYSFLKTSIYMKNNPMNVMFLLYWNADL